MIPPSKAPSLKLPLEPEFSTSFPSSTSTPNPSSQSLSQHPQPPTDSIPKHIAIYSKRHSKNTQNKPILHLDIKEQINQKVIKYCQQYLRPFLIQNQQRMLGLSREIEEVKGDVANMVRKSKFEIEEGIRKILQNVMGSFKEEKEKELTGGNQHLQQMLLDLDRRYEEAIQSVYGKIREIDEALRLLRIGVDDGVGRNGVIGDRESTPKDIYQRSPQLNMVSSIRQVVGSKISEPSSIVSGYQKSVNQTLQSNLKQQIPSLIRNLSIQEGDSEMVMVDQNGMMMDIKGIPIVDSQGNLLIVKLKQIKHLLSHQLEQ